MADEYQIQWEYTNGNTIDFKTADLKITWTRPGLRLDTAVDGTTLVTDPNNSKMIFNFTAVLAGATMETLDDVYTGSITYDGTYPRIQKIYWTGAKTETILDRCKDRNKHPNSHDKTRSNRPGCW
ncbi:MAG: hypothetical protein ACXAEN_27340 [Candidatus Thorarchaeota archaeon]|jgi:hypothetical protein